MVEPQIFVWFDILYDFSQPLNLRLVFGIAFDGHRQGCLTQRTPCWHLSILQRFWTKAFFQMFKQTMLGAIFTI